MKSKTMNKTILGLFVTLFAIVLALNAVTGHDYGDGDFVRNVEVDINDMDLGEDHFPSLDVSDTVEVDVSFTADRDASDVMVEVSLKGIGKTIRVESDEFHIRQDGDYQRSLVLTLPSSTDLDGLTEEATLVVEISADGEHSFIKRYEFGLQKIQQSLKVLSVDTQSTATAGDSIQVDVVVENNGNERLENVYVKVSIADLNIQEEAYIGDIYPQDEDEEDRESCFEDYDDDEDILECLEDLFEDTDRDNTDTVQETISLNLPSSAASGSYKLEVEAYNVDTTSAVKQETLTVSAVEIEVFPPVSQTVAPGKETIFEFKLFNRGESAMVYKITPEVASGLIVEVLTPTVVVPGEGTETVSVKVKVTSSAIEGTQIVTLNVNSESGLVKKTQLQVDVEKDSKVTSGFTGSTDTVFILTVILVIVFVVLLIILIVLLTKRPAESEEFGETSYY